MAGKKEGAIALVLTQDGDKYEIAAINLLSNKNDVGGVRGGWPSKTVVVIPAEIWEPLGKQSKEGA